MNYRQHSKSKDTPELAAECQVAEVESVRQFSGRQHRVLDIDCCDAWPHYFLQRPQRSELVACEIEVVEVGEVEALDMLDVSEAIVRQIQYFEEWPLYPTEGFQRHELVVVDAKLLQGKHGHNQQRLNRTDFVVTEV